MIYTEAIQQDYLMLVEAAKSSSHSYNIPTEDEVKTAVESLPVESDPTEEHHEIVVGDLKVYRAPKWNEDDVPYIELEWV